MTLKQKNSFFYTVKNSNEILALKNRKKKEESWGIKTTTCVTIFYILILVETCDKQSNVVGNYQLYMNKTWKYLI